MAPYNNAFRCVLLFTVISCPRSDQEQRKIIEEARRVLLPDGPLLPGTHCSKITKTFVQLRYAAQTACRSRESRWLLSTVGSLVAEHIPSVTRSGGDSDERDDGDTVNGARSARLRRLTSGTSLG
jgi:hypothetical protein